MGLADGSQKIEILPKSLFIRNVHTKLFIRFHLSTQKVQQARTNVPVAPRVAERLQSSDLLLLCNLENWEISGKSENFEGLLPSFQPSSQNGNIASASKNLLKNKDWTFSALRCFTWEQDFVSNILWMTVD